MKDVEKLKKLIRQEIKLNERMKHDERWEVAGAIVRFALWALLLTCLAVVAIDALVQ